MQCIEPGDKVAYGSRTAQSGCTFCFCRQDWRVPIPINTRFRTVDVEYVLRQSDTRMLITDYSGPLGI